MQFIPTRVSAALDWIAIRNRLEYNQVSSIMVLIVWLWQYSLTSVVGTTSSFFHIQLAVQKIARYVSNDSLVSLLFFILADPKSPFQCSISISIDILNENNNQKSIFFFFSVENIFLSRINIWSGFIPNSYLLNFCFRYFQYGFRPGKSTFELTFKYCEILDYYQKSNVAGVLWRVRHHWAYQARY